MSGYEDNLCKARAAIAARQQTAQADEDQANEAERAVLRAWLAVAGVEGAVSCADNPSAVVLPGKRSYRFYRRFDGYRLDFFAARAPSDRRDVPQDEVALRVDYTEYHWLPIEQRRAVLLADAIARLEHGYQCDGWYEAERRSQPHLWDYSAVYCA
jgi:hypothetical protein